MGEKCLNTVFGGSFLRFYYKFKVKIYENGYQNITFLPYYLKSEKVQF